MKFISVVLLALLAVGLEQRGCKKDRARVPSGCYKGRLEVKAQCMNYTIAVTGGNIDPALVETQWTDESTGKSYRNAFGLESRCTFPAMIKEGDEFWFTIDSSGKKDCAVCMAYYPTPAKKLSIRILPSPCTP